jgi:alpha/beta superfamily hydrolase
MVFEGVEQRQVIAGAVGQLELIASSPKEVGPLFGLPYVAVVCHPHPLHGGTMDNKVVSTLVRTYRDLGIPVVRFNFRGVGASEGVFDSAVGEVDDLLSVVEWAQGGYPDSQLLLAGFSFGSSIAAQASYFLGAELAHLILVAPPVERYPYERDGCFLAPLVVAVAGSDELVDVPGLLRWGRALTGAVTVLNYSEASHFFHGFLINLKRDLSAQLLSDLGG